MSYDTLLLSIVNALDYLSALVFIDGTVLWIELPGAIIDKKILVTVATDYTL